ncbi:transcriptional regulator [Halomonas cupida]|uniref:Transcriptional regulator n=2 Tax=Halomonas cupida TaxID=44933 RepID=A0ABQ0WHF0_9GAMM|nr:LysR family transcriptional regulator [Halomonas cupida]GEN25047.1 transcriptional regulator [Halomonas cupida]
MREHKKAERLMLFIEVAEALSFSRAAETLEVSRGYLSEQIRRLEAELGTALLIRSTRSVRLTEEGLMVYRHMAGVRGSLVDLERELAHSREGFCGELHITAPVLFAERFLLDVCHAFQREHPQLRIHLDVSYTSHDLGRDRFDLAFRSTLSPPQNMVALPLWHYATVCCAAPEYLARRGTPEQRHQLVDHDCLRFVGHDRWSFRNGEMDISGSMAINDHRLLKQLALEGRGIVRVAEYLVDRELADGRLVRLLEGEENDGRVIHMIYPPHLRESARLRAFIRAVRDAMPDDS